MIGLLGPMPLAHRGRPLRASVLHAFENMPRAVEHQQTARERQRGEPAVSTWPLDRHEGPRAGQLTHDWHRLWRLRAANSGRNHENKGGPGSKPEHAAYLIAGNDGTAPSPSR